MSETVDRLIYALDGDIGPFKAKAAQVDAEAGKLGDNIRSKTKDAFDPATVSAAKLERQLKVTAAQYQAFVKESQATGKSVDSLIQAHFRVGQAAESAAAKVAGSAAKSAGAIKLQGYQLTNLTYQLQDTLIQLASGQNPLMVLMQQGPQASGAVGGLANAFKLMGGAAGIARIALGGLIVGGIGALVLSSIDASEKAAKLETQLRLVGNAAGVSRGQVEAMALALDKTTSMSAAGAEKTLGILLGRGNIPGPLLSSAATAAHNLDVATPMKADEAAAYIEGILADPKKGAQELHDQFKLLTAAEQRQVEQLVNTGQTYKAQEILLAAMNPRFKDAADQASGLSKMLAGASGAVANFWHWLGGLTTETKSLPVDQQIERAERGLRSLKGSNAYPGDIRDQEALIARLKAQRASQDQQLAADADKKKRDDAIRAGEAYLPTFNVEGARKQQRGDAVAALTLARDAAKAAGDTEGLARLEIALKNAQNPNYKAGSGVPKAAAARIDTGARDAELAQMELANAKAIAAAPVREREALRAKQQAELEYQRNLADPRRKAYAGTIRDARLAQIPIQQQQRNDDAIQSVKDDTDAQTKLALAYDKGTAAVAAQQVANQAHAAFLQGAIKDEKAYATALGDRAYAQAASASAQALSQAKIGNEGLGRLAAAGGDPAAVAAARRENEALAATQAQRDAARTKEEIEAADIKLKQLREELAIRDNLQRVVAANDNDRRARDAMALKQQEIDLSYASIEVRVKETAAIQAYQQTVAEGLAVGSEEFKKRYEQLRAINEQLGMADATLSGQTNNVQVLDKVRQGLSDVAMAGTRGFKDMRDAAASFFRQLGDLIVQLYVIQPLLDMLLGTSRDKPGGLLGSVLSGVGQILFGGGGGKTSSGGDASNGLAGLFGGGRATGGPIDPNRFYLVGEKGPEILGPGVGGNVYPIRPPSSASMQPSGGGRQQVDFNYHVTVAGNGDKELLGRMQQVAQSTVESGLQQYNEAENRAIRSRIMSAQRRAIR